MLNVNESKWQGITAFVPNQDQLETCGNWIRRILHLSINVIYLIWNNNLRNTLCVCMFSH